MSPNCPAVTSNLLCAKGLAKRQGLVNFIGHQGVPPTEDVGAGDTRATLVLCHADGIIREVFNTRCGELSQNDPVSRAAETTKRAALLQLLYRLYLSSLAQTPTSVRRQIRASEVEAVISAVRRLSFMGCPSIEALAAHAEHSAATDSDVLAHVMDPFQLRHILTLHHESTRSLIGLDALTTLSAACRRHDVPAVGKWFRELVQTHSSLPKDTPQLLRGILLALWQEGQSELGTLAFEIASLDVQLFDDLGWESTRAFCAQLRRVTGPGCEALDAYLTDEDIDDALTLSEELHQDDLTVHFRKLATTYNTNHHRALRKRVLVAAGKLADVASAPPMPVPSRSTAATRSRPESVSRPSRWSPAAG